LTRNQRRTLARCNARLLRGISIEECAAEEGINRSAIYQMVARAGCMVIRRIVNKATGESIREVDGTDVVPVGLEPDLIDSIASHLPDEARYEFMLRVEKAKA